MSTSSKNLGVPELPETPPIEALKEPPHDPRTANLDGRAVHRRKVERFEALTHKEQNDELRVVWKSIAMGIAQRAKQFSTTCAPRDFGKLYQLVNSGATAIDKAFPPKQELQSPKLIVNLFQSLGARAARIAIPETPTIDVTPCMPKDKPPSSENG